MTSGVKEKYDSLISNTMMWVGQVVQDLVSDTDGGGQQSDRRDVVCGEVAVDAGGGYILIQPPTHTDGHRRSWKKKPPGRTGGFVRIMNVSLRLTPGQVS